MRRFAIAFTAGTLASLAVLAPASGQIRLYTPDADPQQYASPGQQPGSLSNLVGSRVFDRDGNLLGTLSSVVTDPQSGQPIYGVINRGGILGFGAESHPVPWQLFRFDQNGVRLNLSEDRLRNSPKYSAEDRPNLMSDRWQRRIGDFYGVQPMYGGQGYGGSQGHSAGQDPFQRLFNRDDMTDIRGTVTRIFRNMQGDQMQVSLRTDDGRTMIAVLAPEWYLQNYGAVPREGDDIRIRGSRVFQDGREFLIATTLSAENQRLQVRDKNGRPEWLQQQGQPHQQQLPPGDMDRYPRGY